MHCSCRWRAPPERRLPAAYTPAFTALVRAGEDDIAQEIMSATTPPSQKPGDEYGLGKA